MESNKFVLPHLYEGGAAVLGGRVSKGQEERANGNAGVNQQAYTFDQLGEELPFFKQYRISLMNPQHNLRITNRYVPDEAPRMDVRLAPTAFFMLTNQIWNPMGGGPVTPKCSFQNMGHLVVLPLGHRVFGIDPVEKKVLWDKDLYGTTQGNGVPPLGNQFNGMPPITVDPHDGAVQVVYTDGWMQRISQTSSLDGQVISLPTKEALQALHP